FLWVHFLVVITSSTLETWQAIRFRGNHGSIGGSWPIAISGSPRGHSVRTVTQCRSTQRRTTYLILPSNRASQEPNRPPLRRNERFTRDAQAACRCNSLASKHTPFFQ